MTIMMPLMEMTDPEIEAEAKSRELNGEIKHAADLRAFSRLRFRFGLDPEFWPLDEIEKEGLRVNKAALE